MKKLILTFILAIALLTSCGGNVPNLEDRIAEDVDQEYEYTGIVETLEFDVYQQGTHQIRMDDDDLVIIQSQNFDLNRYLEKRVIVKGVYAKVIGDEEPVLSVMEIEFEDGSVSDELLDYENRMYGFSFSYPGAWELAENSEGLSLTEDDYKWVNVVIYNDKTDLDAFVSSQESGKGTSVTIGAQRSLRFLDGSTIRMYIPNPPKKKVYKVIFNEEGKYADEEKGIFYNLLESIQLIYISTKTGDKCGGEEDVKCGEGYRCELDSAEEDAEGICVSLTPEDTDFDCPFIPVPRDCRDYRIAEYSKTTGCPTRYECVDSDNDLREEGLDTNALITTIEKYKDQILDVDGAKIIQYELTESESLIAVVYEFEEEKYRTLYSFAPSANEFTFIEKAHFEEGEDRDWELVSGEDVQGNYQKTIIKPSVGGNEDYDPRKVSEDMRLYENPHKDFSMEYPKNWYYRSFGAINNTRWIVGFADKSLDYLSDAIITISILEDEPSDSDFEYFTVRDCDDETVYVIEGPEDLKETIDAMADFIQ